MTPKVWSHSSLVDFESCPSAYYHKRIAKDVVDPPNDAGLAGTYLHEQFEKYLRDGTPLDETIPDNIRVWPTGLKPAVEYAPYLDKISELPGELFFEEQYGLTIDLKPCAFDAEDVWHRGIIDVMAVDGRKAVLMDHKSGKRKFDQRQLKLNALWLFERFPQVNSVRAGYVWLKDKETDWHTYYRVDIMRMWGEFVPLLTKYRDAFHSGIFDPKKSGLCNGWCPVTSCTNWKPKRR